MDLDLLIKDSVSRITLSSYLNTADEILIVVSVYFQSMCASGGYMADSFVNLTSRCENASPLDAILKEWTGSRHPQHSIGDSKKFLKSHWTA